MVTPIAAGAAGSIGTAAGSAGGSSILPSLLSFGGLIGGAGLSGFFGSKSSKRAAREAAKDRQLALDFAQKGLQWRVQDAKAAGIHPLYSMGASVPTYSPGFSTGGGSTSFGERFGQNVGRALLANATGKERISRHMLQLGTERASLENDLLRAKIATETAQLGKSIPSANEPQNFLTGPDVRAIAPGPIDRPFERSGVHPILRNIEQGAIPDLGHARTKTGLAPVPSKDVKERIEDQLIPEVMWGFRNMLLPNFGLGTKPPKSALPPGAHEWVWSYSRQEWQPRWKTYPGRAPSVSVPLKLR